jgi:hypothetical protein
VKKQLELKEELKKLKNQLEVGTRQSWKMLKRGTAVMESAESERNLERRALGQVVGAVLLTVVGEWAERAVAEYCKS